MTNEQFKQLMDKLEEIKRAQQPNYIGYPMQPSRYLQPQPWDHGINDPFPNGSQTRD